MQSVTVRLTTRLSALSSNILFRQLNGRAKVTYIDLSAVPDINPVGVVNLLLAAQYLKNLGQRVHIVLPADPQQVLRLKQVHFLGHLHSLGVSYSQVSLPLASRRKQFASFLPVFRLEDRRSIAHVAARVYQYLCGIPHYPPSEAEVFGSILSELCSNILEHSQSPGGGFVFVETIPRRERPSTIVALGDVGIGLRASLMPYFERHGKIPRDDASVIRQAVRPGVTSKFEDPSARGGGLDTVRRLTRRNQYHLGIRTGDTLLVFLASGGQLEHRDPDARFPGTQVYIALEHQVLTTSSS